MIFIKRMFKSLWNLTLEKEYKMTLIDGNLLEIDTQLGILLEDNRVHLVSSSLTCLGVHPELSYKNHYTALVSHYILK